MRFRFNEKKTAQAAAYLLKLNGGKLDYMVLIKLLFLADRAALVKHGQPLTGGKMVSMPRGPVLSEVLDLINERSPNEGPWKKHVSAPKDYEVSSKLAEAETDELSRYERGVLEKVYEEHGKKDPFVLVKWLHEKIPEWTDPKGGALRIEYADVLREHDVSEAKIQRIREDAEFLWALRSLGQ